MNLKNTSFYKKTNTSNDSDERPGDHPDEHPSSDGNEASDRTGDLDGMQKARRVKQPATTPIDNIIGDDPRRMIKRANFELYIDQLDILDDLDRASRKKNGRPFNKSKFLRDLVDKEFANLGLK